jgi:hypothetical protein
MLTSADATDLDALAIRFVTTACNSSVTGPAAPPLAGKSLSAVTNGVQEGETDRQKNSQLVGASCLTMWPASLPSLLHWEFKTDSPACIEQV